KNIGDDVGDAGWSAALTRLALDQVADEVGRAASAFRSALIGEEMVEPELPRRQTEALEHLQGSLRVLHQCGEVRIDARSRERALDNDRDSDALRVDVAALARQGGHDPRVE